ncbi:unnamed protein product [Gadus morhua 'NCC']
MASWWGPCRGVAVAVVSHTDGHRSLAQLRWSGVRYSKDDLGGLAHAVKAWSDGPMSGGENRKPQRLSVSWRVQ